MIILNLSMGTMPEKLLTIYDFNIEISFLNNESSNFQHFFQLETVKIATTLHHGVKYITKATRTPSRASL